MYLMDEATARAARLTAVCRIYQDARLSAQQRQQQTSAVQRRIIALQIDRGIDPMVLAAAMAEQVARTRLTAQANRTIATRVGIREAKAE